MANFDSLRDRMQQLDALLADLSQHSSTESTAATAATPASVDLGTTLTTLLVGSALLGAQGLAQRVAYWQHAAGIALPQASIATSETLRFALIGWLFETQEQLRPQGNPLGWFLATVDQVVDLAFSRVRDSLPRISTRSARPVRDEDAQRWIARGKAEEERSVALAQVALPDLLNLTIGYLAGQPAVQQAIAALVRSPAMDDAITTLAARPGMQKAILDLVHSPAVADAIPAIVEAPAMQDAVRHLVTTPAMDDAITTLSASPALVELVQTQSSSFLNEIIEEVRERSINADTLLEGIVRRLFGRPRRDDLPREANGMLVLEQRRLEEKRV
jgi:hypothetical protein